MLDAATDSTPPPPMERERRRTPAPALDPMEVYYPMRKVAIALGWYLPNGEPNTQKALRHMQGKPCVAVKRGGRWYTTKSLLRKRRPAESGEIVARLERDG